MNISNKLQKINCILSETNGLYHKLNVELGLSDSIAGVLYALYANEGAYPIMQLRVELSMPKQTLNSALRSLEKDGVLYLEIYSGRSKRAVLTEKGWEYCKDTVANIFGMEEAVFSEFSNSELKAFVMLHEKYNAAVNKYIEETVRAKHDKA
mgnify:CR=1 FL=1